MRSKGSRSGRGYWNRIVAYRSPTSVRIELEHVPSPSERIQNAIRPGVRVVASILRNVLRA